MQQERVGFEMQASVGLMDILRGAGGLLSAHQRGMLIGAQNLSNISTPGYHRRDLRFDTSRSIRALGVTDTRILRAQSPLLRENLGLQLSKSGFASVRYEGLHEVESALVASGDQSLVNLTSKFFNAWRALEAAPDDLLLRGELLTSADDVTSSIRRTYELLSREGKSIDMQIKNVIGDINGLLKHIADINGEIKASEPGSDQAADLMDERDRTLDKLSRLVSIRTKEDSHGSVQVIFPQSGVLVEGAAFSEFKVSIDASTGYTTVMRPGDNKLLSKGEDVGGELGAFLSIRDEDLVGLKSRLNQWSKEFIQTANDVHKNLVDLEGQTGRDLFSYVSLENAAETISLNPDVKNKPQRVAIARDVSRLPGDSSGVLRFLEAFDKSVDAFSGRTLTSDMTDIVTSFGRDVSLASNKNDSEDALLNGILNMYDSHTGISLEEQTLIISQYQRAFEAMSKVLKTVDDMFDALMEI
jgi:flagellar hook-associated protein 1 FlgK